MGNLTFKVDFSELKAQAIKYETASKKIPAFLEKFLFKEALKLLNEVIENTPVDTENLKDSWKITEVKLDGDKIYVIIYNDVHELDRQKINYAGYVEYGHATTNGGWVDGVYMLTFALQDLERDMPENFKREFSEFLERYTL